MVDAFVVPSKTSSGVFLSFPIYLLQSSSIVFSLPLFPWFFVLVVGESNQNCIESKQEISVLSNSSFYLSRLLDGNLSRRKQDCICRCTIHDYECSNCYRIDYFGLFQILFWKVRQH